MRWTGFKEREKSRNWKRDTKIFFQLVRLLTGIMWPSTGVLLMVQMSWRLAIWLSFMRCSRQKTPNMFVVYITNTGQYCSISLKAYIKAMKMMTRISYRISWAFFSKKLNCIVIFYLDIRICTYWTYWILIPKCLNSLRITSKKTAFSIMVLPVA